MKTRLWRSLLVSLSLLLLILSLCKNEELPIVITLQVTDITEETAVVSYRIKSDGGAMVMQHGTCWSLTSEPTILLTTKTLDGSGTGSAPGTYFSVLTGLTTGKTYYIRAYATNSVGTAYSKEMTFTTREIAAPGGVKTKQISALGSNAAISGGRFSITGGALFTECGLCWGESPDPTIGSFRIFESYSDTLPFTSIMTDLASNTTYYARAYVSNQAGISYGNQITVTTTSNVTDIEGRVYHITNIGTQTWLMENLATTTYNDGKPIPLVSDQALWNNLTAPGYCWYNNEIPASGSISGALYNWHAVNTGKLCPSGFHVPTSTEWTVLTTFLGGVYKAGGKMAKPAAMQWQSPDFAYDSCLFWAVACGIRDTIIGFEQPGGCTGNEFMSSQWWSSTAAGTSTAISHMFYPGEMVNVEYSMKNGFSVRCIKD